MAYDIGPRIGVDGEAEFRKEIKQITDNIKTLGTELKVVASAADLEGESIESLSSKNDILNQTIAELEKRLSAQQDMLDKAAEKYGKADSKTLGWQRAVNSTQTELNKLKSQVQQNEKAMDSLGSETDDAGNAMDDLGDAADNSSGKLGAMTVALGNLISAGIQAAISAVVDLASQIWNLDEATEEYRAAQGKLNTAFEAAGYSTETAQQAYTEFYKILGDTDTATEASQLLAKLAENEEDVAKWTEIAAGVSGTFGDSLPIEGLIEAANETAKVGEVTGTLADALNWAGISEDEFNEKLAAAGSESERNQLIMETLAGTYDEASAAFYRNNEALIKTRENQAKLDESLAKIGQSVANVKNEFLEQFTPAISAAADQAAAFISNLDPEAIVGNIQSLLNVLQTLLPVIVGVTAATVAYKAAVAISTIIDTVTKATQGMTIAQAALNAVMNANPFVLVATLVAGLGAAIVTLWTTNDGFRDAVLNAWEAIKDTADVVCTAVSNFFTSAWDKIEEIWNNSAIKDYFSSIWETIKGIFSVVKAVLSGNFSDAWEAIKGIFSTWKSFFQSRWNDLTSIFSKAFSWFRDIGRSIVDGVKNGISNAWSSFNNWVADLFGGLVKSVKNLLGINSPSKVFAGIGENMADGLGVGWEDEMGAVQRQINRSMSDLLPDASASVSVSGAPVASGGYTDIGAAITNALSGAVVYMDGKKVGKLITQTQNRTIRANGLVPTI